MNTMEVREFAKTMDPDTSQYFRRIHTANGPSTGITIKKNADGYITVHPNRCENRYYLAGLAAIAGDYEITLPEAEWERKWRNVVQKCRKWDMWPTHADLIERGLEIGYRKIRTASCSYRPTQEKRPFVEVIAAIDPKLIKNGKVDHDLISSMYTMPEVIRMNLGSYTAEVASAVCEKRAGYTTPRVRLGNVENQVKIDAKRPSYAWYSSEHPHLLNGSYYLVISPTHAVFIDND